MFRVEITTDELGMHRENDTAELRSLDTLDQFLSEALDVAEFFEGMPVCTAPRDWWQSIVEDAGEDPQQPHAKLDWRGICDLRPSRPHERNMVRVEIVPAAE